MSWKRELYPDNWEEIAISIKDEVSWTCEECGKVCRKPGELTTDFLHRIKTTSRLAEECPVVADYLEAPRRYLLTVAHLNHIPSDCRRENLKALCSPCHCRYDLSQMATKRRIKKEVAGQLQLPGVLT